MSNTKIKSTNAPVSNGQALKSTIKGEKSDSDLSTTIDSEMEEGQKLQSEVEELVKDYIDNCKDPSRVSSGRLILELLGDDAYFAQDEIYEMKGTFLDLLVFMTNEEILRKFKKSKTSYYSDNFGVYIRRVIDLLSSADNSLCLAEMVYAQMDYGYCDLQQLKRWQDHFSKKVFPKTQTESNRDLNSLKEKIKKHLDIEKHRDNISEASLIGEIAHYFAGIECPVIHSGGEDSCDRVLEALMVHFAKPDNIEQLPEEVQGELMLTLRCLYDFINTISKHGNLLFDYANLYESKKLNEESIEKIEEYWDWYK